MPTILALRGLREEFELEADLSCIVISSLKIEKKKIMEVWISTWKANVPGCSAEHEGTRLALD